LGELLAASSSLTSLSIGHSGVNNEGSLAIARGLLANSTLQYLDAQSNLFGSLATQAAFTQSLRSPGNALVHLIVKDCGMDAAAAVMLSEGIMAAPRLQFADVSHNMLGAAGGNAFLLAHGILCMRQQQWNKDSLVIAPLLVSSAASLHPKAPAAAAASIGQFSFDVADFPGRYDLHLSSAGSYHSSVQHDILRIRRCQ
jgi:hypothetical protein